MPKLRALSLAAATFKSFNEDKAQRLAAAIAYSTIFSIAPLFIVVVAIAGAIFDVRGGHGHSEALSSLLAAVRHSAGSGAAETVRALVEASFNRPKAGLVAQILGWIFFIVGAGGLFAALQDALNAIWHVEENRGGWKILVRDRLLSFAMILVVGALLVATFVANATISFVGAHLTWAIPFAANPTLISFADQIVSIVLVTLCFALVFKVLPDVKLRWRDVLVGAAVTALLFVVGEAAIGLYFAYGGVTSAYGAAGSLLVALLWIYYSAMILLLGAEFTKTYAGRASLTTAAVVRSRVGADAGADPRAVASGASQRKTGRTA